MPEQVIVSAAADPIASSPHHLHKLHIKPSVHRIAIVVDVAIVVVGFGAAVVEFPASSVSERIGKDLDKCKLSGVRGGIANSAQRGINQLIALLQE